MEPPQPPNCHQHDDGSAEASRTPASSAGRYIGRHRQCPICRFQTGTGARTESDDIIGSGTGEGAGAIIISVAVSFRARILEEH